MKKSFVAATIASMSSFSNQSNSDILFCGDVNQHFKNRYSGHICFAEGDDQESAPAPFKSFANQQELDDYVASLNKPKDDEVSITEKRKQQQQKQQQEQENQNKIELAVVFDNKFDDLIKENADLFPESAKTIRNDVKSDNVIERANLIAATAAKEYFSIEKNVEQLNKADRERVKNEILGVRYESQIDGMKAWELVERSLYGHEIASKHQKTNDFYGKGGNGSTGFKNVDNHIRGWFPEDVVSVPN